MLRSQFDRLNVPAAELMAFLQTLSVTVTAPVPGFETLTALPFTVVHEAAAGGPAGMPVVGAVAAAPDVGAAANGEDASGVVLAAASPPESLVAGVSVPAGLVAYLAPTSGA